MTPVYVPTKPYIKAFLANAMPDAIISRNHPIGCMLLELLERDPHTHDAKRVSYPSVCKLFLTSGAAKRYGGWLNPTQSMQFSKFVGQLIRTQLRTHVITYMYFDPRLNKAVAYARTQVGLSEDDYSDDAIIKDFQRYRERHDAPRIYNMKPKVLQNLSDSNLIACTGTSVA